MLWNLFLRLLQPCKSRHLIDSPLRITYISHRPKSIQCSSLVIPVRAHIFYWLSLGNILFGIPYIIAPQTLGCILCRTVGAKKPYSTHQLFLLDLVPYQSRFLEMTKDFLCSLIIIESLLHLPNRYWFHKKIHYFVNIAFQEAGRYLSRNWLIVYHKACIGHRGDRNWPGTEHKVQRQRSWQSGNNFIQFWVGWEEVLSTGEEYRISLILHIFYEYQ